MASNKSYFIFLFRAQEKEAGKFWRVTSNIYNIVELQPLQYQNPILFNSWATLASRSRTNCSAVISSPSSCGSLLGGDCKWVQAEEWGTPGRDDDVDSCFLTALGFELDDTDDEGLVLNKHRIEDIDLGSEKCKGPKADENDMMDLYCSLEKFCKESYRCAVEAEEDNGDDMAREEGWFKPFIWIRATQESLETSMHRQILIRKWSE